MNTPNILENKLLNEPIDVGKLTRLANYFIDLISTGIILLLVGYFFAQNGLSEISITDDHLLQLVFIMSYLFLLMVMESLTGKSPGKFITRCHVIDETGNPPTILQIIGRNFGRLIPFNGLSFLFGRGWHYQVSKTRVVFD
jgi:uncharacterized RDD family membrane protein YckC